MGNMGGVDELDGTKKNRLALCVIGCGQFAQTFAQSIVAESGESGGIDLSFASRDASRAREYCDRFQGQGHYGSYESAAADPRVEAMYLCTPHYLHREHAALAARYGKHILVEKPIARTVAEGRAIIQDARTAGVTLMVAENFRFMAQVRRCKELVSGGAVGKLRHVQLQEEAPFIPGGWRSDRSHNGGGVFIDGGIHKVHFLRYLLGEPESIFAAELPKALTGQEGEDGLIVAARWPSGAVGLINHSWTASANPPPASVVVSGTEGRISFEMGTRRLRLDRLRGAEGGQEAELRVSRETEQTWQFADDYYGLPAMVQEFRDSIREGRDPEVSGAEGLQDLAVTLTAYASAAQGIVLPVAQMPG